MWLQTWCLVTARFLIHRQTSCCALMQQSVVSSIEPLTPIMRALFSSSNLLPRGWSPNSTTLGIKIATHECWRNMDINTTVLPNDLGCLQFFLAAF